MLRNAPTQKLPSTKKATPVKKSPVRSGKASPRLGPVTFGAALGNEQLIGLAAELKEMREHPPLTRRKDGKYEGDILGFVKGLRLSARLIYFLRERLSGTGLKVDWGHLLDGERSCSPECDVIIHAAGHVREWNGNGGNSPIMNFKFVEVGGARAVISCKSVLNAIDRDYPKALKKYGVDKVFLFAECCRKSRLTALRKTATRAGYGGVWCLYFSDEPAASFSTPLPDYVDFGKTVRDAVAPAGGVPSVSKKPKAK